MTSPVDAWLSEYSKKGTKRQHSRNIAEFLTWAKVTPEQLVNQYQTADDKHAFRRKWGQIVTQFYAYLLTKGYSQNTARLRSASVRSFFTSQCDRLIVKRGAIGKAQMSFGEHEFKLEQLQQMFRVGDIREKAILSLGVCLGYGATAFVELKREQLEKIMAQTEHEKAPIGFWYQRKKTSQPIRSHLTVEAMNALKDYWATLSLEPSEWAFPNGTGQDHVSQDGLNYTLQTLVDKANVQTMGSVRWHLLRKFLFSG